jgi:5-methylcytosine-specific restriction endonuclease McrA
MSRNTTLRNRYRNIIRQGEPPCFCGKPINYQAPYLDPLEFTIDHIIPLARGGEDVLDNLRAAHRACNRDKGDTMPMAAGVIYLTERTW